MAAPRNTGTPFLTVWRPADYGGEPENYSAVQQPHTGLVYVGNAAGLLEFDGAHWRLIPAPGGGAVNALTIDGRGRVWGLSGGTIFRLEAGAHGQWQPRVMNDRLPEGFRVQGYFVAGIVSTSEGVWFLDTKRLICFGLDDAPARLWSVAEGSLVAIRMWMLDDEPYVLAGTVQRVRAGKLEPVPGLTTSVWGGRKQADGTWRLLSTYATEIWDGEKLTTLGRLPQGDGSYRGVILADGRAAFGMGRSGIVICDPAGRVVQTIGREQGLPANQVVHVMEDREGGVWAVTRNGLARAQLDSPYAVHGPAQGLDGTVLALARHGQRLYTGGTEGAAERGSSGRFQPVPELPTAVREVVAHEDRVYFLTTRLRSLRPGAEQLAPQLENRNYFGLLPMPEQPGWFVHGSNEGVRWARFENAKWASHGPLAATKGRAHVLLEAPAGIVWAAYRTGATRVDFRGGLNPRAPARNFGRAEGMTTTPTAMFLLGGKIVALAGGELLRFDETANKFHPESRLENLEILTDPGPKPIPLAGIHASADGTIWLQAGRPGRAIARLVSAGPDRWRVEPLPGEPLRHLKPTTLFHEPDTSTLWIGGAGSLVSCDLTWQPARPPAAPAATVRRIETAEGALLWGGAGSAAALRLMPQQDALRVQFAAASFAPDHIGATHLEYRTRLDGLDYEWSGWSKQAEREFTNLPWRAFRFRVQARDDAGRVGAESVLAFSIAPAWWATRWAWVGYSAMGLFGMAGIVRLRTQALRRRAERLEQIVADRTHELAQSNSQLATQNTELARLHQLELDEKLAAQLSEEKARLELLRYQLNPHFLLNAFTTLRSLVFSSPEAAGKTVERLADFCRLALTRSEETGASVDDEMHLIESYLETEKARWRDELQVEMNIDPAARPVSLPPFLLQPLVENAIKYGGRTSPGTLHVRVSVRCGTDAAAAPRPQDATLHIEIANTGEWVEADSPHRKGSTGIGMENLRQRLRRRYRNGHELRTEARDGWVYVRLTLSPTP